jgi:hypothetical protein
MYLPPGDLTLIGASISVSRCPRPQCTSLSFFDDQSLLCHERETHYTFRTEVLRPYCEGSDVLKASGAALNSWIAADYSVQAQTRFGIPILPDPTSRGILSEDDGVLSRT